MAFEKSKIYWNGNTTQLPVFLSKGSIWDAPAIADVAVNYSMSGKKETTVLGHRKTGKIVTQRIPYADYRSIFSMLSYIQQGNNFGFLFDGSQPLVNTTVTSQISSTVLEVNSTTNIAAAQILYLRNANWLEEQPTVASVTGSALAWTSRTSGTTSTLYSAAYGNGVYVVVGNQDGATCYVATSTDGTTWTRRTIAAITGLYGVTFGNNLFVAVGANDQIYTSPDGITWTVRTFAGAVGNNWNDIIWSGTQFVAVASGAYVLTSPDGITWTQTTVLGTDTNNGVSYSPSLGLYVLVRGSGISNQIFSSVNGTSWTVRYSGSQPLNYITWSASLSLFVAVGNNGTILTSPDGITWTSRTSGTTNQLLGITWTGKQFIAVSGSNIHTSLNGITWTQTALTGGHNAILTAPNLLVIVGGAGEIYTSVIPNRVTFTAPLLHTYASGDILRMSGYYPAVSIPNGFKLNVPSPNLGVTTYDVTIDFEESI